MSALRTQALPAPHQAAVFIGGGFLPVLSIVFHCLGLISLPVCLAALILPSYLLMLWVGFRLPAVGRAAMAGFVAGIIAVSLYDCSRMPFLLCGWGDFIPRIGAWLKSCATDDAQIGYAWRYLGNGGGMGIAFFILLLQFGISKRLLLAGLLFGLFVFGCLMTTLLLFKDAQELMFRITPLSFAGSLVGHIVYGLVLGYMAQRYQESAE